MAQPTFNVNDLADRDILEYQESSGDFENVPTLLPAALTTILAAGLASGDLWLVVDVDANAGAGELKKITHSQLATLFDAAGTAAATVAAHQAAGDPHPQYLLFADVASIFQPLDSDLTAIAALTTTAAGRSVLTISDPNADRVMAWDDSDGAVKFIALSDLNTEGSPAGGDYLLAYTAEGALVKVDWDDLPAGGGGGGNPYVDVQSFTSNGTWTKPDGAVSCVVLLIGGGGGGGSGRRTSSDSTSKCGGGGGGAGALVSMRVPASLLGATESVVVGTGGGGGSATGPNSNGNSGASGGDSSIGNFVALGGTGGGGGTNAAGGSGGTGRGSCVFGVLTAGQNGGAGTSNTAGGSVTMNNLFPGSGGGGGGANISNVMGGGGGSTFVSTAPLASIPAAAAVSSQTSGSAGVDGSSYDLLVGTGGGGGGSASGTAGGGGNGGLYGGGGGGSGGGSTTGSGGNGADGYVRVITLCIP